MLEKGHDAMHVRMGFSVSISSKEAQNSYVILAAFVPILYSLSTGELTISIPISIIFSLADGKWQRRKGIEKKLIENTFMHLRIFKSFFFFRSPLVKLRINFYAQSISWLVYRAQCENATCFCLKSPTEKCSFNFDERYRFNNSAYDTRTHAHNGNVIFVIIM